MNIGYLLTFMAGKVPNKTAVVCGDVRLSYKELNSRANRLAHSLLGMNIKKGDKVALLSVNSIYYPEIFFGILKAGGVLATVNFRLAPEEILYILDNSDARIFIFEKELASSVAAIRSRLIKVEKFICVGEDPYEHAQDYEQLIAKQLDTEPEVHISLEDDCEIIHTSGTTGRPKGVMLTHGNVLYTMLSVIIGRELRPGQTSLVVSPMYHVAGLNNHFGTTIMLGGTAVIIRRFEPQAIMQTIQREKVAYFPAASTIFNMLVQAIEEKKYDTSSVMQLQSGSEITPVEVRKKLAQYFPNALGVYEAYGLTEVGDGVVFLTGRDSLERPASVGKAGLFAQLRVVDDNGQDVDVGEVGEIIIKGPVVMKGYYKNKEETEEAIRNGWLYTGDLGRLDAEGCLYIVGRKKDMIISGGENIYPREIEEVLWRHPKIADVVIIGVPDKQWGEAIRAVVELRPGEKMTEEEVIEFCKQHIASYKKPKSVVFVKELPRNPSGKVLKNEVRARCGQTTPSREENN
jgi:acyl-CoA synthetase (AMP-forming)/AMP-acid ligase II